MQDIDINLHVKLLDLYENVLQAAPNAKIYVMGYPHVAPDPDTAINWQRCSYLAFTDTTGGDGRAAWTIVNRLNEVIDFAVDSANSRSLSDSLAFINPNTSPYGSFDEHDVCSDDSYFYNVSIEAAYDETQRSKIFHPNEMGQRELANIARGKLTE